MVELNLIDQITMTLKDDRTGNLLPVYINVYDNSLSHKWLTALNNLIKNNYHLEKNYCFLGFIESARNAEYIMDQVNKSIAAINSAELGYHIDDFFSVDNTIVPGEIGEHLDGGKLVHDKLNWLHRYFEDLQGVSGRMSDFYTRADNTTRWHIRQLNLLCHEYESLVLSMRKAVHAPEWRRPSQLMCWLHAPRFVLDETDYKLFGIESINRSLGGVFVGVNKAVGKHHYEVFQDEGRDSRIDELTTTTLRAQTEAAGDFDIEWANNPGEYHWQKQQLKEFREWLVANNFDPDDKSLTIGHPQVGQVDLVKSFGSTNYQDIWTQVGSHLNVYSIKTGDAQATYDYNWSDADYIDQQVKIIYKNR
ncbi:hypothetical protein UFOVP112_98 [uncultured Caudovirales phage]|uniref:Uncharacterized protein n=1 Tax=uncultured Caudovirales phage TaxID=2100421 RepID=A0A6J5L780_9CAUD|nr:hypothetical protein UFOVP112_98 [uncultured Caudovirales phage]